ncbi:triphosphoribosyl-dephospho-CoA synthase [Methanohalophilus portucalensis]|uniref:Fumarate hydratase n=2 Tax=Methanohalophilus portucalensis TaxID=39664 RepID=A0A1L9C7B2_9EURY|nr:triphosphoribosyl-dephospho-CoA synthase [Methanohalophilus portucalensis]ATU08905.1 fumarate hydratase [Methanohalophilus portucalensis]OJH50311.1 triphosphoribosyl-dephospho-CoA protein [Methanohalophilus portucalensis FDF-1]RNI11249.1 fumarate hydratase [Methanohalophilus portucalensis FDF-1]SMH28876.1 triphosphoribosyl-dephospho-CoA synthase [Methanohalophilus portucalensis FDF-1]
MNACYKIQPSEVARSAQLAMILEVSASPKPGNIDRTHDYVDTRYEHFLASATGVYPVFERAVSGKEKIGELLKEAVLESNKWQKGGNTHFGAFLLLLPLTKAAGQLSQENEKFDMNKIVERAHLIVKHTDVEDSINFYQAFGKANVCVQDVEDLDLNDSDSITNLRKNQTSLFELMEISENYDMIANEWTNGFELCCRCSEHITDLMEGKGICTDINCSIVYTFLKLLSNNPDTFIQTKFNRETAVEVSEKATSIATQIETSGYEATLPSIIELDEELLKKKINPGSTADIIIGGLFLSIIGGMRF